MFDELVEKAARALWDQQNPLDPWDEADEQLRTVAWHDANAVLRDIGIPKLIERFENAFDAVCAGCVVARRAEELAEALRLVVESIGDGWIDLSACDYWARTQGYPGADPTGICSFGCYDEPQCQTCEPEEGWPLHRARMILAEYDGARS